MANIFFQEWASLCQHAQWFIVLNDAKCSTQCQKRSTQLQEISDSLMYNMLDLKLIGDLWMVVIQRKGSLDWPELMAILEIFGFKIDVLY